MPTPTKDVQKDLAETMRLWMKVENASVTSTSRVMEKTDNPVIHAIMEIIQADSRRHYHIQDFIARSMDEKAITLSPDDLSDVWDLIETHIEIERRTIELAKEALDSLKGRQMVVQEYLLHYLLMDEQKHNDLLDKLSIIKKGMYPY